MAVGVEAAAVLVIAVASIEAVLRTVIAPTWEDIGKLAAIAALRTLLNFILQREIETAARHDAGASEAGTHRRAQGAG